jgi:hypothetical protein
LVCEWAKLENCKIAKVQMDCRLCTIWSYVYYVCINATQYVHS